MAQCVRYQRQDSVAAITMDDGKVNVISLSMATELNAALDRAEAERAVVLLGGRDGVFSAGFDLSVLRSGGAEAVAMLRAGFELAERILSFPLPVVIACTGHAVAMGAFLLLSGDYRLGGAGGYRLTANEVAIGLTMPRTAVEILRQRLAPASFNRAVTIAEPFSPANAVEAGFLDRVVPAAELDATARTIATQLSALDMTAHAASKLRARGQALGAIRTAIDADFSELRAVA
ncbi:MAG TPA: crotonase/enoyl-CoA hydratase family protein [Candidatus Dormibacteraeota bacterium]|nr:crotonase/enoyl-CoA hydratase family protein [Candidatus Dormibacteraeota bacterium]